MRDWRRELAEVMGRIMTPPPHGEQLSTDEIFDRFMEIEETEPVEVMLDKEGTAKVEAWLREQDEARDEGRTG